MQSFQKQYNVVVSVMWNPVPFKAHKAKMPYGILSLMFYHAERMIKTGYRITQHTFGVLRDTV